MVEFVGDLEAIRSCGSDFVFKMSLMSVKQKIGVHRLRCVSADLVVLCFILYSHYSDVSICNKSVCLASIAFSFSL